MFSITSMFIAEEFSLARDRFAVDASVHLRPHGSVIVFSAFGRGKRRLVAAFSVLFDLYL